MQEAQRLEHRALLGRGCCGLVGGSLPPGHCEPGCRLNGIFMRASSKFGLAVIAVVVVFVISWYFWGWSRPPLSQPPLTSLSTDNFTQFRQAFDQATDRPRLVLLLSPT